MPNEIITQPFLLLNLSDGESKQTYVHIMYSAHSDGTDFSNLPNSYMGIYAGPLDQPPQNKEAYTWSKIEGSSTYMDFRYSDNNGESFTAPNGLIPGAWLGVGIFDEDVANNPNYIPNIQDYTWTKIQGAAGGAASFYIQFAKKNIHKFCSLNKETKETIWTYSPEILEGKFYQPVNGLPTIVENADIKFDFRLNTETVKNYSISGGEFQIEMDTLLEGKEIDEIIITCSQGTTAVLVEALSINYGTSEEMLRFIINLDSFNAAIFDTSMKFDETGLTVTNGSFKLLNNNNESVFSVDEKGNIKFSGSLNTMSGNLGGWVIDEYGLYSGIQKNVGLYASNKLYHIQDPSENNPSPIRIWAGYKNTILDWDKQNQIEIDAPFAVTESGALYALNANIKGTIHATSGLIENKFLVGNEKYGIIISGKEKDSTISTAQFSSGVGGYGWKISSDGSAEFNNILARGKIQSSVFEYNKISSVGGDLYIAPTIYVENKSETLSFNNGLYIASWTLPYTSQTINGRIWEKNDTIKLEGKIVKYDEDNLITESYELVNTEGIIDSVRENKDDSNSTKSITLTVSFSSSSLPKDITNLCFYPGTAIILYGKGNQRNGIYLTASGPYMEVYNHDISDTNPIPAVRLGNLVGIEDNTFPQGTLTGYGLYTSNAFLRGQLMLPGVGLTNQNWAEINGSPIRIWAGKNTENASISSIDEAPFIVTEDGSLYASKGIFKGRIEATSGSFSGSINTAGILLNRKKDNTGCFYVAYNTNIQGQPIEEPLDNNDYLLNINHEGLSIWEGGLQAFSDQASAIDGSTYFSPIYGYNSITHTTPYPYFYLIDEVKNEKFEGRIVTHKAHFFSVKDNRDSSSILINDGLWFFNKTKNEAGGFKEIEKNIYSSENSYKTGISLINNCLTIQNNNSINIISEGSSSIYFNGNANDLQEAKPANFTFRGNIKVTNNDVFNNTLAFNNQIIKEINITKTFTVENSSEDFTIKGIDIIIS